MDEKEIELLKSLIQRLGFIDLIFTDISKSAVEKNEGKETTLEDYLIELLILMKHIGIADAISILRTIE